MSEDIYEQKTMEKEITKKVSVEYLINLPNGYDDKEKWPLVVFFHGMPPEDYTIRKHRASGPGKHILAGKEYPFVFLSPFCPPEQRWDMDNLVTLIRSAIEEYKIDKNRVYLTGFSMGGYATWDVAMKIPDTIAAIVPICGRANVRMAEIVKDMPVWMFHGEKDEAIPIRLGDAIFDRLKELGSDIKYTKYPGVGHDSWTQTYENPEMWEWLMEQRR